MRQSTSFRGLRFNRKKTKDLIKLTNIKNFHSLREKYPNMDRKNLIIWTLFAH